MFSASRLSSSIRSPMNFNRRSPEEFQWKIFLGEDLQALAVLAVLCHLDGKLFVISQTMNKHNSLSRKIHENEPWSSAAKSMLPGNAKCFMTSLADTKQTVRASRATRL